MIFITENNDVNIFDRKCIFVKLYTFENRFLMNKKVKDRDEKFQTAKILKKIK